MMIAHALAGPDDTAGFWQGARAALAAGVTPEALRFVLPTDVDDLFGANAARGTVQLGTHVQAAPLASSVSPLVESLLLHAAPERFALAYRLLWRAQREPALGTIAADPDVAKAADCAKAVRRDMHKMKAFVRFRAASPGEGGTPRYIAWFEPAHHIVRAVAPFFVGRFTGMCWSILTPRCSAHWDGEELSFSGGATRADAPEEDRWKMSGALTTAAPSIRHASR